MVVLVPVGHFEKSPKLPEGGRPTIDINKIVMSQKN